MLSYAGFLSIFALDVFEGDKGFLSILIELMIHLTPTFLLILIVFLSWKREWIAGISNFLLAAYWIWWAQSRSFPWLNYLTIVGPLLLTGILFWICWFDRRKNKAARPVSGR